MKIVKEAAMNDEQVQKRILEYTSVLSGAPQISGAVNEIYRDYESGNKDITLKSAYAGMLYAAVFAPALIGFVEWVLENAEKNGKYRLYFLSRDGWQMYLIASQMIRVRGLSIECRYLSVSRYSMKLPAYHLDIDKSIDSICVGGIDVTAVRILKRAGLTDEECREVLEETGIADESGRLLNYHEVIELKEKLRSSKKLIHFIYGHSTAAYDTAVNYLIQEGLCGDDSYYLVDSGWIGTLQCTVEKLVKSVNPDIDVEGCYFGMYEYPQDVRKEKFHTYYFSPERGLKHKCTFSNSLFETIVSSDEGMTMGYKRADGKYVPVKLSKNNPNFLQIKENIRILERLLGNMTLDKQAKPLIDRHVIYRLFRLFMSEPTQLEVSAYGDSRFSDNVLDDGCRSAAAQLDIEQIRNQRFISKLMIVFGIKKYELRESAWIEGSAVKAYGDNMAKRKAEFRHIRLCKGLIYMRKQMKA